MLWHSTTSSTPILHNLASLRTNVSSTTVTHLNIRNLHFESIKFDDKRKLYETKVEWTGNVRNDEISKKHLLFEREFATNKQINTLIYTT
jgi:hypothetical protein